MRRFKLLVLAMAMLVCFAGCENETGRSGFKPKEGFVPTKDVAIKIAVAVWEPIYGVEHIAAEKPYQARLTNGVWIIEGSLPHGSIGGVAQAQISKDDGKILTVSHGQ